MRDAASCGAEWNPLYSREEVDHPISSAVATGVIARGHHPQEAFRHSARSYRPRWTTFARGGRPEGNSGAQDDTQQGDGSEHLHTHLTQPPHTSKLQAARQMRV
jgi:hypothetical protein